MGILMVVAIPAVTRTIENSRKDTFVNVAKNYADSVKTLWTADGLVCGTDSVPSSSTADGSYYVEINTAGKALNGEALNGSSVTVPNILEQGGKSSWGNRDVFGYVVITVATDPTTGKRNTTYGITLSDGIHGVDSSEVTQSSALVRGSVKTSAFTYSKGSLPASAVTCVEG